MIFYCTRISLDLSSFYPPKIVSKLKIVSVDCVSHTFSLFIFMTLFDTCGMEWQNVVFSITQKRLDALHQSQVNAYHEAATKAIKDWAMAFPLEPMEDGDSEQAFVDRCVSALAFVPSSTGAGSHTWPNWKLEIGKALAKSEIRKRAKAIFEKYRAVQDNDDEMEEGDDNVGTEDGVDTETGDEVEGEDNEEQEEGEEKDAEAEVTNSTQSTDATSEQQQSRRNHGKRPGDIGKPTVARKKGTPVKGYRNKGQSTRGGRRGGRGGTYTKKNT
jgi:hypothetical protein